MTENDLWYQQSMCYPDYKNAVSNGGDINKLSLAILIYVLYSK